MQMSKKIIKIVLVLIVSALVSFGIARLGGAPFGHNYKLIANLLFGFLITFIFFKRDRSLFIASIIPTIVLSLLIHFYYNSPIFYQMAVPSTLAFYLGLVLGYIFIQKQKSLKIIAIIFVITISFTSSFLYDNWTHKINYGTYTGEANIALDSQLLSFKNQATNLETSKPLVLYYWNNSCGVCYESFPKFDQLHKQYQDIADFYLVNITPKATLGDNTEYKSTAIKRLKERNVYTTNVFYEENKQVLENHKIFATPTIIIIDNNKVKFVGNTFTLEKAIKKL